MALVPIQMDVRAVFDIRALDRKREQPDVSDVDAQQVLFVDDANGNLLVESEGKLVPCAAVPGYLGTLNVGETLLEFLKPKRARLLKWLGRAAKEIRR